MSNLLKKGMEPEIAVFGFPAIQSEESPTLAMPLEGQPQQDELSSEALYRIKLLELERRTQEIERDAYTQGFAQGERDGLDYGQKSILVIRSQIERILQDMGGLPSKILHDYRDWLIHTSIIIARQIVNRELLTSPEIVADIVRDLVQEAEEHSTLTVYLNPNDLDVFEKRAGLTLETGRKQFSLKADRDLERGNCRVESAIQLLDGSITGMFQNLEKKLLQGEQST